MRITFLSHGLRGVSPSEAMDRVREWMDEDQRQRLALLRQEHHG